MLIERERLLKELRWERSRHKNCHRDVEWPEPGKSQPRKVLDTRCDLCVVADLILRAKGCVLPNEIQTEPEGTIKQSPQPN